MTKDIVTQHPADQCFDAPQTPANNFFREKIMSTVKQVETIEPREIRRKLGLNQQQFWSQIGVTQSGGSRYESGRNMPKPVRELLRLVHVEQIDIQRVKREDLDVVEFLKSEDPTLYKTLKKSAKAKQKKTA